MKYSDCSILASALVALTVTASHSNAQSLYTPYAFTNFAGLPGVPGTNDGIGTAARLNGPSGVAADNAGNVYVGDIENHTIRKITPAGVVTTLAGSAGQSGTNDGIGSEARFYRPYGLAVDGAANVYVADHWNHTIRKITPAGDVTTLAGSAGQRGTNDGVGNQARFYRPSGMAVDSATNVYVADQHNHTIRKITPAGEVTTLAGNSSITDENGFPLPGSGDGTGSVARFNYPRGVAVDASGNVYVGDTYNNTIRKITPAGEVTTLAGNAVAVGSADGTNSAALFRNPWGVAVDSAGNVYVADASNQTIRKVTAAGVVTTLAGSAGAVGSLDGTGSTARFFEPLGVAVDTAGNIYVADSGNSRISRGRLPDDDLVSSIHISAVDVCWAGRTDQMYQVQYTTNISDTNWFNLGSPVPGTGTNCVTDGIGGTEHRFYRIIRVP